MYRNLTNASYTARVLNATAAGQADLQTSAIDTVGGTAGKTSACRFTVLLGAIAAGGVPKVKLQSSPDNTTWTDIAGSSNSYVGVAADATKLIIREVFRPPARYVRAYIDLSHGAGNVTIDGAIAELFLLQCVPPSAQDTTVKDAQVLSMPLTGTA